MFLQFQSALCIHSPRSFSDTSILSEHPLKFKTVSQSSKASSFFSFRYSARHGGPLPRISSSLCSSVPECSKGFCFQHLLWDTISQPSRSLCHKVLPALQAAFSAPFSRCNVSVCIAQYPSWNRSPVKGHSGVVTVGFFHVWDNFPGSNMLLMVFSLYILKYKLNKQL